MSLPVHGFPDWQVAQHTADIMIADLTAQITAGNVADFGFDDVRRFQAVQVTLMAEVSGVPTGFGDVHAIYTFGADPGPDPPMMVDAFQIFPFDDGGTAFDCFNGVLMYRDVTHGPHFGVRVENNGPDTVNITGFVWGQARAAPGQYVRETKWNSDDRESDHQILIATGSVITGAGVDTNYLMRCAPGEFYIDARALTTAHRIRITTPSGVQVDDYTVAAGAVDRRTIVLPQCSMRFRVTNTGGGAGTHFITGVNVKGAM